jgi:hypothetical protein
MQHPDEGMIHTWLDGELSQEDASALEAHVAGCEECKAAVAEARGFIAASSRIVGTLDNVPSGVIPVAKPAKRKWYSSPQFRAAAAVLIVAGASFLVTRTETQKTAFPVMNVSKANEATTAERVMSATSPEATADSAPIAPVVADIAASKKETAKPETTAPPKGLAVPSATLREPEEARISVPAPKIANEADFSGKGVKGGAAFGVAGGVPARDTAVLTGRVAGVAAKAADALSAPQKGFAPMLPELKIIRVDSTATIKKITYQSLSGSEVLLTEEESAPAFSKVMATGEASRQAAAAATAAPPSVANAPVTPAPAAQRAMPVHTITWIDPSARRRYTLSGSVSVEELEAIKARLLLAKH